MSHPRKQKLFLALAKLRNQVEDNMANLAWEMTPNEIKILLVGEPDLYNEADINDKKRWLIGSLWEFSGKSPIELILENRTDEVAKFIISTNSGTYS